MPVTTVTRTSQLGLEVTKGTVVPANKLYHGLSVMLAPSGDFYRGGPQGYKLDTIAFPLTEFTAGQFTGLPDYQALTAGLASAIVLPTPTRNIPTTGLSYTWVFTMNPRGPDEYATFTADMGDSVIARRAAHVFANGITITFSRRGFGWTAPAIGRGFTTGVTMTASPTEVPTIPIIPQTGNIYIDTTYGGLGGSKQLSDFSGEFSLTNRRATKWPMNSSLSSFDTAYELKPEVRLTLTKEADAAADALLTPMRAGDTRYIRVEYLGTVAIETTYFYKLWLDFAAKVVAVPTYDDQDGLQVSPWVFGPVSDTNLPGGFRATLVNTISSLT